MLKSFLDHIIKYEIDKKTILKFKALSLEDHFYILQEESEFLFWMLQGVKTENGEIIEDHKKFTNLMMSRYPRVVKLVIALCYINTDEENLSLQEKIVAVDSLPAVYQLEILNLILEKSYPAGMYETVKKMEDQLIKITAKMQS